MLRTAAAEEKKGGVMDPGRSGGLVEVNGARIYREVRGSGPSVLFVSGSTGDAGHFGRVVRPLSDEFTVVTYDRRGNSRSSRLAGWNSTSTQEHSEDAAKLIEALDIAPAAVFGTSAGAIIALDLMIRHPELLRGAILHEPPLNAGMSDPEEVRGAIQRAVEGGTQSGGPRGGVETFLRFVVGDETYESFDHSLLERMLGNGETLSGVEFGVFDSYRPDDATLAGVRVPVVVMVGAESLPYFGEASRWLAARLDAGLETLPGGHSPYIDRPQETARALRPLLRRLSG
jgi:pimeloyl-ACP methyl ester carboxylesterase